MATRRDVNVGILSSVAVVAATTTTLAATSQDLALPPPSLEGGKTLRQALEERQSIRDYADRALPPEVLSNVLWAAWGVNRPHEDGRTAPRWRGVYALDIYLVRADGVWRYEPHGHRLIAHIAGDLRAQTTTGQGFVATAPLNLVYVFDTAKLSGTETEKTAAAAACVAMAAQNVYLCCAAEGLATVFRESVPGEALARTLKLPPTQIILFAQTVGYPKT